MAGAIDKAIAVLAGRQHGYVARVQLLKLGLTPKAIRWRVQTGWLIPVYAGVYAVGYVRRSPEARAAAAVLACGEKAVLSHGSAASTLLGALTAVERSSRVLVLRVVDPSAAL
jgi:hypothetical protein